VEATNLANWIGILAALAIIPFVLTMVTSFAKLVIVFGLIRQALGTPQIPPNVVITGLSLILTVHVMYPRAEEAIARYESLPAPAEEASFGTVGRAMEAAEGPMTDFLERNSTERNRALFRNLRTRLRDGGGDDEIRDAAERAGMAPEAVQRAVDTLTVLAPAFVLTELTEAFQIGFLIFVPFLIIDLVVGNILLAMGMHMMSPITISLPLKLLLFVLVDGWETILTGLVLGYA